MAPPGSAYSEEISARTSPGKVHSAGPPIDARPFKLDTHPLAFYSPAGTGSRSTAA